jgi:peptidoglycan/LPS O-acetylase OafA/YrhL
MPGQEGATTHLSRSTHVDVLRAIAALMVIGYHVNGLVGGQGGSILWLRDNTDSGVELFFVLSGYLIALPFLRALVCGSQVPDTVRYALRRAARILPGYWLALVAATFVAIRIGALPPMRLLLPQVALLQGLIPDDPGGPLVVAWTLSIEAAFYVGVPVATWLLLRRRRVWSIRSLAGMTCAVWAVSAALAFGFAALAPGNPWSTVVLRGPGGFMCQFCPGILVALLQIRCERAGTRLVRTPQLAWMLIAGGAVGWLVVAAWSGQAGSGLQMVVRNQVCGGLFGLVLMGTLALRAPERRVTRLFSRIGTVSYGMYLWHWLAFEAIVSTGLRVDLPLAGIVNWVLATGLLTVATLPLAIASWRFVEARAITWASDRERLTRITSGKVSALSPPVAAP